jgi:hypothetical protein
VRSLRWLIDSKADRETIEAQLAAFFCCGLAGGGVAYFRFANHNLLEASLAGVLAGSLCLFADRRVQHHPAAVSKAASRSHVFEIVFAAIGLGL